MSTDPVRTPRRLVPGGLAVLALVVCLVLGTLAAGAPALRSAEDTTDADNLGCGSAEVTRTLDTGSAWRMCVRVDPMKGLVLEHVQFRPAAGDREYSGWLPVIDSVYLAQLVVPYDSSVAVFNDVTDFGFGDTYLLAQTAQTCLGETMPVQQSGMVGSSYSQRTIPGICLDEIGTGLAWGSQGNEADDNDRYTQQGSALEVSSITKLSWYEYQQKVTLTDQGEIRVALGATGDLAPISIFFPDDPSVGWPIGREGDESTSGHAASHWHNAIYRVDFGIGSGPQQVEQWDYARPDPENPYRVEGTGTVRGQAFHAEGEPDPQTWWRVLNPTSLNADGHPRSYEIVNSSIQNRHDPITRPKVSFTNDHACQEYASGNLNADCRGQSVRDYVQAETEPLTDPVAWVNVGFHHVVRDEDQSPMPAHWQEFSLVPRDLLAQQATTPIERSCLNGGPFSPYGSCSASNLTRPKITTGSGPLRAGSALSSDTGTWRSGRAPLTFQRLWLRDGAPISTVGNDGLPVSATGAQYTLTAADLGRRISVRVDATGDGVVPGSATSEEVAIPNGAGPTGPPVTQQPTPRPADPPVTEPAQRVAPRLQVTVPTRGARRLVISVRGSLGMGTGKVVVRGPGWSRSVPLRQGRVIVRVPSAPLERSRRVLISYRGDAHYLPSERAVRVRPAKR